MHQTKTIDLENSLIYAQTIQNGLLPKNRHFKNISKIILFTINLKIKLGEIFIGLAPKKTLFILH